MDVALAPDAFGRLVVHTADCPQVRAQADAGVPVLTMLDIQAPVPPEYERHGCMEDQS